MRKGWRLEVSLHDKELKTVLSFLRQGLVWIGGTIVLSFTLFMVWYYAFAIHPSRQELRLFNPAVQTQLFFGSLHHRPAPGFFTVYAHGIGPTLNDGRMFIADGTGISTGMIGPDRVAELIRQYGWDGKTPVHLIVCKVGDKRIGLAQRLADDLGVPVYATDKYYYIGWKGIVGIYDSKDGNPDHRDPAKPGGLYRFDPQAHRPSISCVFPMDSLPTLSMTNS